jgi:tRNA(Ile)-lysidine synthase
VPSTLSNFETLARSYRYKALGKACREENISHLLTAHHAYDQAETVLLRMLRGQRGRGLGGMKKDTAIPECYGMHGVHCSGGIDEEGGEALAVAPPQEPPSNARLDTNAQVAAFAQEWTQALKSRLELQAELLSRAEDGKSKMPMRIEYGGLRMLRPLMRFSKPTLIRTCKKADMPWFEDITNADPTITTRNAIRHLYQNHILPKVLGPSVILQLAAAERRRSCALDDVAASWTQYAAWNLEPRAGTIIVRFTDHIFGPKMRKLLHNRRSLVCNDGPVSNEIPEQEKKDLHVVSLLILRDLIETVSPRALIPLKSLISAGKTFFPDVHLQNSELLDSSLVPKNTHFTVAGVRFRRHLGNLSSDLFNPEDSTYESYEWHLSREPHSNISGVTENLCLSIPPLLSPVSKSKPVKPQFELFDGRYWIKVENKSQQTLSVRPLRQADKASFKESFPSKLLRKRLENTLRLLAPGDVRYTLPVIVDSNDRLLALPSLGISSPWADDIMKYEIRYKSIPNYLRVAYERKFQAKEVTETKSKEAVGARDSLREVDIGAGTRIEGARKKTISHSVVDVDIPREAEAPNISIY